MEVQKIEKYEKNKKKERQQVHSSSIEGFLLISQQLREFY